MLKLTVVDCKRPRSDSMKVPVFTDGTTIARIRTRPIDSFVILSCRRTVLFFFKF